MQGHNLTHNVLTTQVMNSVAAGTSAQNSASVDLRGYEGVRFIADFGTLTATQVTSVKAQQSSDDGVADDFSDIKGSLSAAMADGDSNKILILDIYRPQKRYVRLVVNRATANAVIDGVVAELYRAERAAIAKDADVSAQVILSNPAEGTA